MQKTPNDSLDIPQPKLLLNFVDVFASLINCYGCENSFITSVVQCRLTSACCVHVEIF